ncbi:uncharacterized protein ATNIH1004_010732 [Aspergillus tanneri]|uniref:Mid2 domain-containing protein n=1 Tax=Aspergillus tanneri TaxID=1220188 RepID=A0A5M9MA44_9EURO|nr:uncharacterized protein ATNIH1004_010732 [Aspergillus tanneri]KAA8641793.1 hypothetical protein ATNIH1004_010732 [Aspergillus tanneri]
MSESLCYAIHGSSPSQISVDLPCGVTNSTHPHVTCCVNGDYCLSNSFCAHTRPDGSQGFYNADCTDPKLEDPICGTRCGGRGLSDLVYNETTGYWACCWNSITKENDCKHPSNEIYPAPAPSELKTIQYLPKLGSGTPTYATVTATASEASGETSSEESEADISSDGISAGEAAGIGVGVGMGIILIAALAFVLFFRKRATKIERRISPFDSDSPGQPEYSQQVYELDKNQAPTPELDITP